MTKWQSRQIIGYQASVCVADNMNQFEKVIFGLGFFILAFKDFVNIKYLIYFNDLLFSGFIGVLSYLMEQESFSSDFIYFKGVLNHFVVYLWFV